MSKPIFLAENYFSEIAFPDHTLSANEEANGAQVHRIANGRRAPIDRWTPTTANQDAGPKADLGSSKPATMLVLDRGHNLDGETVKLQKSTDDFAANVVDVFTATVPSSTSSSGSVDDANGAVTDDGAWLKRFTSDSSRYWRLLVLAMGPGLKPIIVGAWLGRTWEPDEHPAKPHDEDEARLSWTERTTPAGWTGAGTVASPRASEILLRLPSFAAYGAARERFRNHWIRRRPSWYVPDPTGEAERAMLIVPEPGSFGMRFESGTEWGYRQVRIRYVEHEAELV